MKAAGFGAWGSKRNLFASNVPRGNRDNGFTSGYDGRSRGLTLATVIWETVFEEGLDGFRLERGSDLEGPWVPVGELILPAGQGGEGASYAADDAFRARSAREVYYRVLVLEGEGDPAVAGPVPLSIPRGSEAH